MDLTTERLRLEPFGPDHVEPAMELFTSPEVRAFLGGPVPPEYARQRLRGWLTAEDPHFAVIRAGDNAFLGIVDLAPYHEAGKLELSYLFLPAYWGNGYAEESIRRILQYCKEELHLSHVVSETQQKNIRSRRLLERLGYTLEQQLERFGAAQCMYGLTL